MSELPKKSSVRSVRTRRALKEAFCRLYIDKPLNKIAIKEVCRIAGYNRSTFYQYYLDLDDLLLEIETETLTYIAAQRKTVHTSDSNFISELMELYEQEKVYMMPCSVRTVPRGFSTIFCSSLCRAIWILICARTIRTSPIWWNFAIRAPCPSSGCGCAESAICRLLICSPLSRNGIRYKTSCIFLCRVFSDKKAQRFL